MSVELGSVRGDKRKEILERQAVSELEQEKALHQLAVERANRACERADAAEAERDAAREALARGEALADELDALAKTLTPCTGRDCPGCRLGAAVSRIRAALAQPATNGGWLTREAERAKERAESVPPHARPTIRRPATDEGAGA